MGIDITSGINLSQGIILSASVSSDPNLSLGTSVAWTSNTIFDTWSSSSSSTTDGTANVTTIWQLFYAHKALRVTSGVAGARIGTYTSGTNNWQWAISISGSDNSQSNFAAASTITSTTGSIAYSSGGTYTANYNATVNIPAFRYFIIGRTFGPFYYASRTLAANRTATIGDVSYFTVVNKIWKGSTTTFTIPSQLGGSATYTEVSSISQVAGLRFDVV